MTGANVRPFPGRVAQSNYAEDIKAQCQYLN
ncbi:hypothetical protein FHW16_004977 [Phyllobacterium myrsinacearum]|uniref:Uncharacterized protein n=1 Tax=Phyllobacterium myrsinacearum TaxID=28101 RepID=A0A839EQP8_9HYPH|nr:hypothetical protein [Phyllobacterium myrsinacearum]